VCAISTMGPLPVDPADVAADEGAHARLEALCRNISPVLAAAPIKARQVCFRPVTEDGLPLIGAVPGVDGGFVATGHSVWGMLNAPATGEAMSELILDGAARHVDLTPSRLSAYRRLIRRVCATSQRHWYYPIEHPPALDGHVARSGKRVAP
jgi:glycine/D-amino acid oxidase-like deaminating enzyme